MSLLFNITDLISKEINTKTHCYLFNGDMHWVIDGFFRTIGFYFPIMIDDKLIALDDLCGEILENADGSRQMNVYYTDILVRKYVTPNDYVECYFENKEVWISDAEFVLWTDKIMEIMQP